MFPKSFDLLPVITFLFIYLFLKLAVPGDSAAVVRRSTQEDKNYTKSGGHVGSVIRRENNGYFKKTST